MAQGELGSMQLPVTELGAISTNMRDERAQLREVIVLKNSIEDSDGLNGSKRQNR